MKLMFRVKPQSSYYNGNDFLYTQDFPFPRSDTILHSIISTWKKLWGKTEQTKLIENFNNDDELPFYITSALPLIGKVYFLPCPASLEANLNNISWISSKIYKDWLDERDISWMEKCFLKPNFYVHNSQINDLPDSEKLERLWIYSNRERNLINSFEVKSFFDNQIFYNQNLELYIIVELQEEYKDRLKACFRLLADEGIGGKRSIGCGGFFYRDPYELPQDLEFFNDDIDENFMNLSLYLPDKKDIENGLLKESQYKKILRQSWGRDSKGISWKKKSVNLLKEGSTFKFNLKKTKALLDVTPDKAEGEKFYHYVYPFKIKVPRGVNNEK